MIPFNTDDLRRRADSATMRDLPKTVFVMKQAANEIDRLRAQEAERKAELDNIHNTILPRLTEELRKLQKERDRYRNALKEINQEYKDWDRIGGTPFLMAEIAIKALKGESQ